MLKKTQLTRLVSFPFSVAMLSLACAFAWWASARADTESGRKIVAPRPWASIRVELPVSDQPFPPGIGRDIASSQCLICHSAAMVLTQPPLKKDEWRAEIIKMRTVYGAPVPEDQVDALSEYLKNINGRE